MESLFLISVCLYYNIVLSIECTCTDRVSRRRLTKICVLFVSSVQNKVSFNWDTTLVLSESDVILHNYMYSIAMPMLCYVTEKIIWVYV